MFEHLCVLLTVTSLACDPTIREQSTQAQFHSVRDSMGIEIVESSAPAWTEAGAFQVSSRPAVRIGVADGPDEYMFGRVRSAWRLADGRIVVADEPSHEIRFYSSRGQYLRATGRNGEGPGEFRTMWHVRPYRSDSLFVFDYQLNRASIFDGHGRFGRAIQILVQAPNYWAVGTIGDSLLTLMSPGEQRVPLGHSADSTYVLAYADRGQPIDTLGRYPLAIRFRGGTNQQPEQGFFLPYASFAPAGDRYFWGLGDKWEITEYTTQGQVTRVIRPSIPVQELTADRVTRFKQTWPTYTAAQMGARGEASAASLALYLERAYFPATVPAYSKLIVDDAGYLWAETFRQPSEPSSAWVVLDPTGIWLGQVSIPDGLEVEQIGHDFVLGIRIDADGVSSVEVYELSRSR